MYVLSEEMHKELLTTFEAARNRALLNKDEDSASYYWGLVEYLQGMPKTDTLRDFFSLKKQVLKGLKPLPPAIEEKPTKPPKDMTLKQVEGWLKRQIDLTNEDKFELYYQEHSKIQAKKKKGLTYTQLLKGAGIKNTKK